MISTNDPKGHKKVRFFADQLYPCYFDRDQLYNLTTDSDEQINVFGEPEYQQKKNEMKALLKDYLSDSSHSFGEFNTSK